MYKFNAAGLPTIQKAASERLDYPFDFTNLLAGDTIAAHEVIAQNGITCDATLVTGAIVAAWVLGGTAGQKYTVACKVTGASGRIFERTIVLDVVAAR